MSCSASPVPFGPVPPRSCSAQSCSAWSCFARSCSAQTCSVGPVPSVLFRPVLFRRRELSEGGAVAARRGGTGLRRN
eukprot:4190719-Pyramimonas_sp.AAC.1